jgi:hypothetical protein
VVREKCGIAELEEELWEKGRTTELEEGEVGGMM